MIYIIRHGQTEMNSKKLMQGRSDIPLNETGIIQAKEAGERLRRKGISFGRVYSSPLIRAVETAENIAGGAEIVTDGRLTEIDCGPYEGMDLNDPAPEVMAFFSDFVNVPAPPGMEPLPDITARLGEFLEEIKEEAADKDILISTHAIAMKGALEYLTPESNGSYWSEYIGNCEIYAAAVTDAGYGIPYRLE